MAYKIALFISAAVFIFSAPLKAGIKEDIDGLIPQAVQTKVEEFSKPVFDPGQAGPEAPKADPFFEKLRKKHRKFSAGQQRDRAQFIKKVRSKNYTSEELQEKLKAFHRKQNKKAKDFLAKEQKSIQKHNDQLKEKEGTE